MVLCIGICAGAVSLVMNNMKWVGGWARGRLWTSILLVKVYRYNVGGTLCIVNSKSIVCFSKSRFINILWNDKRICRTTACFN